MNDINNINNLYREVIQEQSKEPRHNNSMKKRPYWKHGEDNMSVKQLNNELAKINELIAREEKKLSEYDQSEHSFIRSPSILNILINAQQGLMKLRAEKIGK